MDPSYLAVHSSDKFLPSILNCLMDLNENFNCKDLLDHSLESMFTYLGAASMSFKDKHLDINSCTISLCSHLQ